MDESLEIEFVVLVSTTGDYIAVPRGLMDVFVVEADARDAVDERVAAARSNGEPTAGWGCWGSFRLEVERAWWEPIAASLRAAPAPEHRPTEHRSVETNANLPSQP